jgi:hypothetical protein
LAAESALRQINALGNGMGGWLGGAISQAATLAATLWDAAAGAAAAAMLPPPPLPYSMPMGGPGTFPAGALPADAPPPMRPQPRPAQIDFGYVPPSPGGGGGSPGGGGSAVDEGMSPWFDPEQEQQILDAVDALTEAQERYNDAVTDGAETVADLFISIVDGSMSAKEALADLLAQMAQVQLQRAVLGLAGSGGMVGAGFAALSGALTVPSMDGGGYTGSAPRSGGLDGRGGFLAMLHPQETVMDHTRGQGQSVSNVYNIDARGAEAGVEQKILQALQAYDRQLAGRVRQINADPRKR